MLLGKTDQLLESRGILDGHVGQYLPVQEDLAFFSALMNRPYVRPWARVAALIRAIHNARKSRFGFCVPYRRTAVPCRPILSPNGTAGSFAPYCPLASFSRFFRLAVVFWGHLLRVA